MRYPFIAGSAPSQSKIATSERTVNFYVELIGTEGPQNRRALYPTPGQQAWITAANSGGVLTDIGFRGGLYTGSRAFLVIGGGFYEAFSDARIIMRGTVAQDANVAQLSYNGPTGNQVGVVSGGNYYVYNLTTNVLSLVLTGEANQIGMLDEYFLALNQTTGRLRLSNLNDGSTWDPTQFALRSAQPDPWVALLVNPPDILLLGLFSGDVWYDAGTSPFPLAARAGLNIPYGIVAPWSLAMTGGRYFWLSSNKDGDGLVVSMSGYQPVPISTLEVDTAIATYRRNFSISDAESLVFQAEGHTFYVLRFPSANATWLYDLTTNIWTELGTWNSAKGDYDVWHPRVHLSAFGMHLVGEAATGTISKLDVTYATEPDGSVIRRLRRGPVLVNEMRRQPLGRFEVGLEAGLGLVSGQGSKPQVMGRFSDDGGKTWSNERNASAGEIGNYRARVAFTRLGSPRLWVPELTMTDPIPWRIVDAYLNNGLGRAA